MSKHPYELACTCVRCIKERERRTAQSVTDPRHAHPARKPRTRRTSTRRPVAGTQEWAETRGDDIDNY